MLMKACNITQAACQAVVCGTTWLQAACQLLAYRTHSGVGVKLCTHHAVVASISSRVEDEHVLVCTRHLQHCIKASVLHYRWRHHCCTRHHDNRCSSHKCAQYSTTSDWTRNLAIASRSRSASYNTQERSSFRASLGLIPYELLCDNFD